MILSKFKRFIIRSFFKPTNITKVSVEPVSKSFGFDRGTPIDRYYIEKFLSNNSAYIQGVCMEIAERDYTIKFGGSKVSRAYVLHVENQCDELSIKGNLENGEGIPENFVDCFIVTQTLPFIYDVRQVAKNIIKVLKPGGVALITVPGITQISRYDMDRWGHFWSFTDLTVKRLFSELVPEENIDINTYGNVKVASSFLYGLCLEEISHEDLDHHDKNYQLIITAKITKPL